MHSKTEQLENMQGKEKVSPSRKAAAKAAAPTMQEGPSQCRNGLEAIGSFKKNVDQVEPNEAKTVYQRDNVAMSDRQGDLVTLTCDGIRRS